MSVSTSARKTGHEQEAVMSQKSSHPKGERPNRKAPSQTHGEEVSDPHPGSISDGTHPEASEVKHPRGAGDPHAAGGSS